MIGVLSFGFTVKGMSISQGYSQKYFFIINLKSSVALRVLGQDPSLLFQRFLCISAPSNMRWDCFCCLLFTLIQIYTNLIDLTI